MENNSKGKENPREPILLISTKGIVFHFCILRLVRGIGNQPAFARPVPFRSLAIRR